MSRDCMHCVSLVRRIDMLPGGVSRDLADHLLNCLDDKSDMHYDERSVTQNSTARCGLETSGLSGSAHDPRQTFGCLASSSPRGVLIRTRHDIFHSMITDRSVHKYLNQRPGTVLQISHYSFETLWSSRFHVCVRQSNKYCF